MITTLAVFGGLVVVALAVFGLIVGLACIYVVYLNEQKP